MHAWHRNRLVKCKCQSYSTHISYGPVNMCASNAACLESWEYLGYVLLADPRDRGSRTPNILEILLLDNFEETRVIGLRIRVEGLGSRV